MTCFSQYVSKHSSDTLTTSARIQQKRSTGGLKLATKYFRWAISQKYNIPKSRIAPVVQLKKTT